MPCICIPTAVLPMSSLQERFLFLKIISKPTHWVPASTLRLSMVLQDKVSLLHQASWPQLLTQDRHTGSQKCVDICLEREKNSTSACNKQPRNLDKRQTEKMFTSSSSVALKFWGTSESSGKLVPRADSHASRGDS